MSSKPLIIGESNPYGGDPAFALYPFPDGCSGHRLCCLILGMRRQHYLDSFDRANLCVGKWSMRDARKMAEQLWRDADVRDRPAVILCGSKVAQAFAAPGCPAQAAWTVEVSCQEISVVCLPHPSGLCRRWNEPGAFARSRTLVAEACPEVAPLIGLFV